MAAIYWVESLLVIYLTVHFANGLYFHMGETEKKCFIEEIPDETMVIGRFFFLIFPLKDRTEDVRHKRSFWIFSSCLSFSSAPHFCIFMIDVVLFGGFVFITNSGFLFPCKHTQTLIVRA